MAIKIDLRMAGNAADAYAATHTSAIYDANGVSLEALLTDIYDKLGIERPLENILLPVPMPTQTE